MHVEEVTTTTNGGTYTYYVVRQTCREGGKVRHRTIANISRLPKHVIESLRLRFKSGKPLTTADEQFAITGRLPACRSDRFVTTMMIASGLTFCCVCWPVMSNGTCANG